SYSSPAKRPAAAKLWLRRLDLLQQLCPCSCWPEVLTNRFFKPPVFSCNGHDHWIERAVFLRQSSMGANEDRCRARRSASGQVARVAGRLGPNHDAEFSSSYRFRLQRGDCRFDPGFGLEVGTLSRVG